MEEFDITKDICDSIDNIKVKEKFPLNIFDYTYKNRYNESQYKGEYSEKIICNSCRCKIEVCFIHVDDCISYGISTYNIENSIMQSNDIIIFCPICGYEYIYSYRNSKIYVKRIVVETGIL